ncbi:MAG TPA: ABC transporter substrate-binding protein [bacterium]|nr:ABC transporter substrate-binding protein [bacterium]
MELRARPSGMPEAVEIAVGGLITSWHFNTTDISVISQMTKIKAANPQAVIAWRTGTPIATGFKGIAAVGFDFPVYTTDGNQTYAEMEQFAAFLPKDLYFASAAWNALDAPPGGAVKDSITAFYSAFRAAGIKPDNAHTLTWDPTELVMAALRKFGIGMTATQLRDTLAQLTAAPGINGLHTFVKYPQRGLSDANALRHPLGRGQGHLGCRQRGGGSAPEVAVGPARAGDPSAARR